MSNGENPDLVAFAALSRCRIDPLTVHRINFRNLFGKRREVIDVCCIRHRLAVPRDPSVYLATGNGSVEMPESFAERYFLVFTKFRLAHRFNNATIRNCC